MANSPWEKDWSHSKLYQARNTAKTQGEQDRIANAEHGAFAKEAVTENPAMAVPLLAAIPVYQGAKALGLTKSRSSASVAQASAAYEGVQEGLKQAAKGPWDKMWGYVRVQAGLPPTEPKDVPTGPWTVKPTKSAFDRIFDALVKQESGGKHTDAKGYLLASGKGAKGITQVMMKTGEDPGYGVKPIKDQSKEEYLRFGRDYLKAMEGEFGGDMEKALAAYNAGVGNVKKAIDKGGDKWKDHLPKKSETLPYIKNIMKATYG
jgi:hypothetical protein